MNDYLVTLHNNQKLHKFRTVRCCVSTNAAARVADYLERLCDSQSRSAYQSTYVKQLS